MRETERRLFLSPAEYVDSDHPSIRDNARALSEGISNPIDKVPGRIPGAVNAPWNETPPELPDGELVAYCGSGVTASVLLHRLHLAGREGQLYPGSWSEWEQLGLPVERS